MQEGWQAGRRLSCYLADPLFPCPASLPSTFLPIQNDRLVIDGCLAAMQHNNERSQRANQGITEAFDTLLQVVVAGPDSGIRCL
jgi:hypothetical protein